ncbi:MAG: PEP-CTERM sorting domain-containing protein [Luteolibacter sp.]
MKIKTLLLTSLAVSGAAHSAVLVTEDFTYADDSSLTANANWSDHSGNPGDLLVSGGAAVVQHGAPSEDANIGFADQTTGILSATFDIIVQDDAVIGGSDFEYFAHFFTDGSFNFRARASIVAPTGTGDYTLGIATDNSTEQAILTQDFSYGNVVNVALFFDLDTGGSSLTVGSETIVGTTFSTGETINRFALRQSDSTNNETITVDNLVIDGVVPEPSSAVLGALGALVFLRRRR